MGPEGYLLVVLSYVSLSLCLVVSTDRLFCEAALVWSLHGKSVDQVLSIHPLPGRVLSDRHRHALLPVHLLCGILVPQEARYCNRHRGFRIWAGRRRFPIGGKADAKVGCELWLDDAHDCVLGAVPGSSGVHMYD